MFASKLIRLDQSSFGFFIVVEFPCLVRFVNGNPSGSLSEIRSKKAFVEEWVFISGEPSEGQNIIGMLVLHSTDHSDCIPETPRISKQFDSLPLELTRLQEKAPLPPSRPRPKCNFSHPRQLSPLPERLELPFSNDGIWSGYEEFDSSGKDLFTTWVKMSEYEILVQHMVDIHKATAEFREASERKPATNSHISSSSEHFATRTIVQRRLSIYNGNPGTNCRKVAYHYLARCVQLR